jgi:PqqD family protein of HPr-rel-A system
MTLWRAASVGVHLRQWAGELVIFNEATGDTHCLDRSASAMFQRLRESPQDDAELKASADFAADPLTIGETIEKLSALSLILPA